ncbi:hypothetical protein BABINDRAFT_128035 [Babjeviella inositovora NRRL Y-12698]|uniref:Uncharacterized protein n=1 Tax=Babjeviella inositovora NRRL Y-12698 TaxID=984486 RepID=A0A1E3QT09_9ASCO|nr:uncharacterized protein BABINDRAFT_128035 [Babjeviella inositovora NRRL Y-12698]ODQ80853.1 hypothetical protein BABINDRAFT_128035 [Babjeviella inositovora NRRL Y-12698]
MNQNLSSNTLWYANFGCSKSDFQSYTYRFHSFALGEIPHLCPLLYMWCRSMIPRVLVRINSLYRLLKFQSLTLSFTLPAVYRHNTCIRK